tara:strand:- start:5240 stop:6121 length:882 start_codon:yes stop_codon:yes gene_type:complete
MIITCPTCSARYVVDPVKIGPAGRTVKCAKCGHAWAQPAPTPEEMAGAAAEPPAVASESSAAAETAAPADEAPEKTPAADDIASAFEERIGREPAEPDDGDTADNRRDDPDDPDGDFRANFDDAFRREPESAARPLRNDRSANLPALPRDSSPWPARIAWITLIVVVIGVIGGALAFQQTISKSWPPSQKLYDLIGMSPEPIKKRLGVRSVRYTYPDKTTLRIDGELVNLSKAPHDVPNLRILFLDDAGKVVKRWTFPPPERRMLPDEVVKFATEIKNPPADAKRIDVGVDEN